MTTPQHAMMTGLITYQFTHNIPLIICMIILSVIPDVVSLCDEDWKTYNECHELKWYNLLIPFWNLHILIDYPLHNHDGKGGWKWYTVYIEIVCWIVEIFYIAKYIL